MEYLREKILLLTRVYVGMAELVRLILPPKNHREWDVTEICPSPPDEHFIDTIPVSFPMDIDGIKWKIIQDHTIIY